LLDKTLIAASANNLSNEILFRDETRAWMESSKISRRNILLGTGASLASIAVSGVAQVAAKPAAAEDNTASEASTPDQIRRMKWWHAAKFGMFIHFGLYSVHERHEWAMENEAIP